MRLWFLNSSRREMKVLVLQIGIKNKMVPERMSAITKIGIQ